MGRRVWIEGGIFYSFLKKPSKAFMKAHLCSHSKMELLECFERGYKAAFRCPFSTAPHDVHQRHTWNLCTSENGKAKKLIIACNIPQAKGSRSWACGREKKRHLWFMLMMCSFSLLLHPGFSFQMPENRWADRCCAGDCRARERRSHQWYSREFASRVVCLGGSRRGVVPHWREGSC